MAGNRPRDYGRAWRHAFLEVHPLAVAHANGVLSIARFLALHARDHERYGTAAVSADRQLHRGARLASPDGARGDVALHHRDRCPTRGMENKTTRHLLARAVESGHEGNSPNRAASLG